MADQFFPETMQFCKYFVPWLFVDQDVQNLQDRWDCPPCTHAFGMFRRRRLFQDFVVDTF